MAPPTAYDTQKNTAFFAVFLAIDVVLLLLVFVPTGVFFLKAQPFNRGFYCDDESISHPYKNDTVTIATVAVVGTILPLVGIVIVEVVYYIQLNQKFKELANLFPVKIGGKELHAIVNNIVSAAGYFTMGLAVTLVFTETGKCIIGRLRPHFISVCNPQFANLTCAVVAPSPDNVVIRHLYVEDPKCQEPISNRLMDARKSFPSGHSSVAIYCMLFLSLYMQYRIHWKKLAFSKVFLQSIFMLMAVGCCLSRISDYKHHWSDVLAGSLLGFAVAFYIIFLVWNLPHKYYKVERAMENSRRRSVSEANEMLNASSVQG